ncbi:hypothetical protein LK09_01340 [Microbacterium mangrovi]|uniref:Lipoprotein n=1 Tax=Microbacterium mangrovi TaxID=1348253 RepID=A0A0B2ADR6_9MICO|nr:hypothetical protein [Microbacterium mangrovi]KHK99987.1 hypothetical protein LK09_01340 [Microbacterium mangrovi]
MNFTVKLVAALAGSTLVLGALAGCAAQAPRAASTASAAAQDSFSLPSPSPLTELPEWARDTVWIVYPKGLTCSGTEGCPNDYRAAFGEPGPVLPEGVREYDPATDWLPSMPKAFAPKS